MIKSIYKFFHRHYHSRYHGLYRHAKKLFVFDLALLAATLALLGASIFFFFWKPTITDLIDLNFSFGNDRLLSGNPVTIIVEYINRSEETLHDGILAVHLPEGFIIDREITPETILGDDSTRNLGEIKPGGTGEIKIAGVLFAEPNADQKITAYLTYRPGNKNATEQKISAAIIKTTGSILEADVNLPNSVFPGRDIQATLTLKNVGEYALDNITITPETDESFANANLLRNLTLQPGETKAIAGVIKSGSTSGTTTKKFNFDTVINNKIFRLLTLEKNLEIIYPKIETGLQSKFEGSYVDNGTTIPIRIYWHNTSEYKLNNVKIIISPTPGAINLQATALNNNLTVEGNTLVADAKTRTALGAGEAGSSDEFTINLVAADSFQTNDSQLEIKMTSEAELPDMPGQTMAVDNAETIRLPLATQVSWTAQPVYYTAAGDQLGRGPLPPEVGETTKYWIFVQIENGVNAIAKNIFSATLADGVEFTGKESVTLGPQFTYNKDSNVLSWNYYLAPANSEIGLYFEVAVTPTAAQVGQKLRLIKSISFTAEDDVVGKTISLTSSNIFNILSGSDRGSKLSPNVGS